MTKRNGQSSIEEKELEFEQQINSLNDDEVKLGFEYPEEKIVNFVLGYTTIDEDSEINRLKDGNIVLKQRIEEITFQINRLGITHYEEFKKCNPNLRY